MKFHAAESYSLVLIPMVFCVLYCHIIGYFSPFQVYLYGGHVTSWKNDHGEELLFVSSKVPCSNLMLILSTYHFVFVEVNSAECNYKPLKGMYVHALILSFWSIEDCTQCYFGSTFCEVSSPAIPYNNVLSSILNVRTQFASYIFMLAIRFCQVALHNFLHSLEEIFMFITVPLKSFMFAFWAFQFWIVPHPCFNLKAKKE